MNLTKLLLQKYKRFYYCYYYFDFITTYLNGIKATSSLPADSPILCPRRDARTKVTVMRINVKNVHIQASGENRFVRFQNLVVSWGYDVHQ